MADVTQWVECTIRRGSVSRGANKNIGLRLTVKADPLVEDYFKQLANGRIADVSAYGDTWQPLGVGEQLSAHMAEDIPDTPQYTLNGVSMPLIIFGRNRNNDDAPLLRANPAQAQASQVNLSILRLVGISGPEGVTIGITGAYSFDYCNTLRNKLPNATRQFLNDYVVPITYNLQITSRGM